jgi:hypothetical protein
MYESNEKKHEAYHSIGRTVFAGIDNQIASELLNAIGREQSEVLYAFLNRTIPFSNHTQCSHHSLSPGTQHPPCAVRIVLELGVFQQVRQDLIMTLLEAYFSKAVLLGHDFVSDATKGQDEAADDASSVLARCAVNEQRGWRRIAGEIAQYAPIGPRGVSSGSGCVKDVGVGVNKALDGVSPSVQIDSRKEADKIAPVVLKHVRMLTSRPIRAFGNSPGHSRRHTD